ncbi:Dynein light chain Tctex-type [Coemansia furcata]|uniref:Dynein light chain Tctex-type n=1 Tax=Coemansia furcata TaxID=417177 RepID=A0ACC1L1U5_9FUNG|nr:Dynein light chain Tctex-type [Coemansia furcata]
MMPTEYSGGETRTMPTMDEVKKYLKSAVDMAVTGGEEYLHSKVPELQKNINDYALKKVSAAIPPTYKVIVTCMIVQNTGSGIHTASTVHWQPDQDMTASYVFHNDAMVVDVNAFIIST